MKFTYYLSAVLSLLFMLTFVLCMIILMLCQLGILNEETYWEAKTAYFGVLFLFCSHVHRDATNELNRRERSG